MNKLDVVIGWLIALTAAAESRPARSSNGERGLSQSTEQAVLLAGAVTIAVLVVTIVTSYVRSKLEGLG